MPTVDDLRAQLGHTLRETNLALGPLYRGKVRDNYRLPDGKRLAIVTTDRLSAFDHVLTTLPFKGELLSRLAVFWFLKTSDVFPNHLLDVPDPNVMVCRACRPLPIEVVVRGHLTGSLWRDYESGSANAAYGISIPPGMRRNQRFEAPLLTPSTKAERGQHDLPISEPEIVRQGLIDKADWARVAAAARALFARGQQWALSRGLILVDTKYEFGFDGKELLLIDEIHTPDSSRYWIAEDFEQRFAAHQEPQMLDKENLRQWLIQERGFAGHGPLPDIPDDVRIGLAQKYMSAFERITGGAFEAQPGPVLPRIEQNLRARGYLK